MQKIILSCFYFLVALFANAQTFPVTGAYWHYQLCNNFFPYVCGPSVIVPAGPAVINSINCTQVTIANSPCLGTPFQYLYQSNDTVYHYLPSQGKFSMLYDFSAQAGDVWNIISNKPPGPNGSIDSVLLQVDSTAFIQINSVTRKILYTSYVTPSSHFFDFDGPIVEGIGSLDYFFPQYGACDPLVSGLRCYDDSIVGHFQPNAAIACDSVISVGIHAIDDEIKFSVYPNPFSNEFKVEGLKLKVGDAIKIVDVYGKEIYLQTFTSQTLNFKIQTLNFSQGVYFLEISSENKKATKKLIKL